MKYLRIHADAFTACSCRTRRTRSREAKFDSNDRKHRVLALSLRGDQLRFKSGRMDRAQYSPYLGLQMSIFFELTSSRVRWSSC